MGQQRLEDLARAREEKLAERAGTDADLGADKDHRQHREPSENNEKAMRERHAAELISEFELEFRPVTLISSASQISLKKYVNSGVLCTSATLAALRLNGIS